MEHLYPLHPGIAAMSEELAKLIADLSSPLTPIPTDVEPQLTRFAAVRAVIFDVYGTLFCSGSGDIGLAEAEDREDHIRQALQDSGISLQEGCVRVVDRFHHAIRAAQQRRRDEGITHPEVEIQEVWRATLRELAGEGATADVPDDTHLAPLAVRYECLVNPVWPMPGLEETLRRLKEEGILMGIVSNAQFFTPTLFDALAGGSLTELGFSTDARVYSFELREAKPSVRLYELLQAKLKLQKIEPHEVLYVGNDMRNDIWPAHKVGFKTCLFAGDKRSLRLRKEDPEVSAVKPDLIVTHLSQVADCVLG